MSVQSMIYLDNAATTIMPSDVIDALNKWINKGNPSASYKSAEDCRKLMKEFREYIAKKCNIVSWEEDDCKNS
jgi:cysteine sulfinate desulfinase/cysteine desulfurase-like protein